MPVFELHKTTRILHLSIVLFGLTAWVENPAAALLTWQNTGTGDWFDGVNWDAAGNIPGAADTARILNGGAAEAGSSIDPGALTVGSTSTPDAASGSLTVTSGDLALDGILQVGNTISALAANTSVTGSVNVAGGISGVTGSLAVGLNQGLISTANGSIKADSYAGTHNFVGIGFDDAGGTGNGSLVVNNDLSLGPKATFFLVGFTFADGLAAHGELRAAGGDVLTGSPSIGTHNGSTAAAGTVSGVVDLGTGSLSSDQTGALIVGKISADRSGTAVGELRTAGLSGFGVQSIGIADANSNGSAIGTLVVGAGGIAGESLAIGTTSGAADAAGSVEVAGGDVVLNSGLYLGNNSGAAGSTADGGLRVTDGDLRIGGPISMGLVSGSDAGKQAVATLDLANGELAARLVGVGQATGAGSTNARMTLENVSGRIQVLQVGFSNDAQGDSNGRVELLGSVLDTEEYVAVGQGFSGNANGAIHLTDSRLNVGVAPGSGTFFGDMYVATGIGGHAELTLERSLIDVADGLFLNPGSQLRIALGGGLRVAEYGAIDAGTAFLGGDLQIAFDFTPILNDMVFDLLISGVPDGISGDFANVSILGLNAAYSAVTGTEITNIGGTNVEVYRLRVSRNGVPAPATALLMLLGLVATLVSPGMQRKGPSNLS